MRDGLGTVQTFTSPAAGANFSTAVPAGYRWRIWGGSALLTASATAANRNPFLTYTVGTSVVWASGINSVTVGTTPDFSVTANQIVTLVFEEHQAELNDLYVTSFLPIHSKALWLPAAAVVAITVQNLDTTDQLSNIGFLIETAAA